MATATEAKRWQANAIMNNRIVGDETAARFDKIQINGVNHTVATVYRREDARLIKTAPELLEACEIALSYFEETRHGREWTETGGSEAEALREALAKARELR